VWHFDLARRRLYPAGAAMIRALRVVLRSEFRPGFPFGGLAPPPQAYAVFGKDPEYEAVRAAHESDSPVNLRVTPSDAVPWVAVGQPISSRAAANAVTAAWRSSRVCAAETWVRIRALPTGTTG